MSHVRRWVRFALAALFLVPSVLAQTDDVAALRGHLRAYRVQHDAAIVRELMELVALPNVASDSAAIRRNAAHLVGSSSAVASRPA